MAIAAAIKSDIDIKKILKIIPKIKSVEGRFEKIGKIKDNPRIKIPIFGNGDIDSPQKAKLYRDRYGVDGIMIGRAAIGNPWIFKEIKHYFKTGEILPPPSIHERVEAAREHLLKSVDWKGEKLGILEMRRHYTNYFRGLRNVKAFRMKLVLSPDANTVLQILNEVENFYS